MMKSHYLLVFLCTGYIGWSQAEVYKKVDADGHVTYSSTPTKGSKKLNLEPLTIVPSPARARNNIRPSDFLKVDSDTQKNRDNLRHKILEEELSTEQKLVEEARLNLINGKENSEILKDKDGRSYRNEAKYEENIKSLQGQVVLHEKNVEALKTELHKLK
jgi:bifunctional DNA-binding transcriptional regulator/antitoxin component of YhaV-PrlF toxin-antitoxin module